jgi:hypothetical protein
MSWRASAYVKQLQNCPNGEPISRGEKFVALILADSHQDKTGAYTFPSVETIAADALIDERTCRRTLAQLESKGVIRRMRASNQGRGQVTFYSFPELDEQRPKLAANGAEKGDKMPAFSVNKGGQNARLFFARRGAKGGQKEDKSRPHTKGRTGTGTQKQKITPPAPPARAGGSVTGSLFPPAERTTAAARGPDPASSAPIEAAIEQCMSGCAWTKRRLREKLRAAIALECDKGAMPATTALAIMAAWKFQTENSSVLRGKFGAANFIELGIWKDANLLLWDHERIDRKARL